MPATSSPMADEREPAPPGGLLARRHRVAAAAEHVDRAARRGRPRARAARWPRGRTRNPPRDCGGPLSAEATRRRLGLAQRVARRTAPGACCTTSAACGSRSLVRRRAACARSRAAGPGPCPRRSGRSWRPGTTSRAGSRWSGRRGRRGPSASVVAHMATSPAFSFDIEPWPPVIGMPVRPIQAARHTSRRAASISVATSASVCWMRCCSSSGCALLRPCPRGTRASTRRPPARCREPRRPPAGA